MSRVPPNFQEINPGYQFHLSGTDENGGNVDIFATVPEAYTLHIQSDYEPLLPFGSLAGAAGEFSAKTGGMLAGLDDASRRLFGYSGQVPALSQLIWRSTSPIDLHFPLQFNAITSAKNDVMKNLHDLLALQCPSVVNGVLKGPGPSIFGDNKYKLYLHLGKNLVFSNVVVVDVSANMDTMFETNGDYISVQVDVTISTGQIITKDVLSNIFGGLQVDNPSVTDALGALGRDISKLATGSNSSTAAPSTTPPASQTGGF